MSRNEEQHSAIEIFQSEDGDVNLEVKLEDETVWLTQTQMCDLFGRDKSTISRHIRNVFDEGELDPEGTVAYFATVQTEGHRTVERTVEHYNLDIVISVGYRVKSQRGVQFRRWATRMIGGPRKGEDA